MHGHLIGVPLIVGERLDRNIEAFWPDVFCLDCARAARDAWDWVPALTTSACMHAHAAHAAHRR
jgi:hypothetical protein